MSILLSAKQLTTRLRVGNQVATVVDGLTFDLHSGKTLALVGESGCGKSMTALSLMRILPEPPALPSEGEVWYDGQNLLTLPEGQMRRLRGAKLAMIFQDPMTCLNPVYTVGQQLVEVVELHLQLFGKVAKKHVLEALESVGIASPEQRMEEYPHQLSGGMKQRVMIAMALLCEPDILIADEPTTALDVTIQAQVLDLMRNLQNERGTAILLITHDMGVVAEMADEVIVMYASQAIERGPVEAIFDHKAHPYTRGLFDSRPTVGKERLAPIAGTVPPATAFPTGCHFHPRCPKAMNCCKEGKVPSYTLSPNHSTNCWLYDE